MRLIATKTFNLCPTLIATHIFGKRGLNELQKIVCSSSTLDNGVIVFYSHCTFCTPGGEGGMVGFPDFIYKHIVPACFLAPLKPTFDLTDAQTILVSFHTFKLEFVWSHHFIAFYRIFKIWGLTLYISYICLHCVYMILYAVCNDVLFSPSDTFRMCTYIEDDL